jgi:alkylated DNA nucleotide flippase Atl1
MAGIKHYKFAPKTIPFSERVVKLALRVPSGKVTTYGRLVKAAGGAPILAQSVTNILGKAWQKGAKDIPFHRIVYADGRIWVNEKRRAERMKKYKQEGIQIDDKDRVKNFKEKLYRFD